MDVVGLGYCVWDSLVLVRRIPEWDDPQPEFALDFAPSGGGPVATALVTLARLGATVGFIGNVGDDDAGQSIRQALTAEQVNLDRLRVLHDVQSRQTTVLVQAETGKRSFLSYPGSVGDVSLGPADRAYITAARFLHLDGLYMAEATKAARWMRQAGGEVVYDANRPKEGLPELLPHISVLISNASFPTAYTGLASVEQAAQRLLDLGPRLVVVTLSEQGCLCFSRQENLAVVGFEVPVLDTTGAGDAFHGAFIYGMLQGWSTQQTALFANAVAAINCTGLGGRAALPSQQQTMEFLSSRGCGWQ